MTVSDSVAGAAASPLGAQRDHALDAGVESLRGVGPKLGAALRRRGFDTVRSLLTWTPTRYFDERSVTPLGALMEGAHVVVEGTVARIRSIGPRFRSRLEVTVESSLDAPPPHGTVRLVWFRAGQHIEKRLSVGARIVARGRVDLFRGEPNIVHPTLDRSGGDETALGVRPNYAPLEGIPAGTFAGIMRRAAELYADLAHDRLSPELRARHALPALGAALRAVHCPPDDLAGLPLDAWNRGTTPFHARIGFEHMFLFELCLRMRRAEDAGVRAHAIASAADPVPPRLPGFPFDLTGAQVRAAEAILTDLSGERPMRRLLQGDVGSGKTIVALLAARRVAESGHQAALLVPTEVLAEQHFRTFSRVLEGTGVGVELVVGGLRAAARRRAELRVASGEARIVIGTHALLNRGLPWKSLALAVIDEQHRFGVGQRLRMVEASESARVPHLLIMTATPIPRTLALVLYGDLEVSLVDEKPPGRVAPVTRLYPRAERERALRQVERAVAAGGQAYVVCPSIEADAEADRGPAELASVEGEVEALRRRFPSFRVDAMHGALAGEDRHAAMAKFESGETHVLVSTTVVEVGVDVPRANVILVENAERFGLAQLHQLRGRVGRAGQPSACLLLHGPVSPEGEARLEVLAESDDGFRIAEADLELRGPGDVFGHAQSGFGAARALLAEGGGAMLEAAREEAAALLGRDPHLTRPEHAILRNAALEFRRSIVREEAG